MFNFIYMFHEAMAANMWPHQQQAKLLLLVVVVVVLVVVGGSFLTGVC